MTFEEIINTIEKQYDLGVATMQDDYDEGFVDGLEYVLELFGVIGPASQEE